MLDNVVKQAYWFDDFIIDAKKRSSQVIAL